MASANLANAVAVASIDGEPLACSGAFRERLGLSGDGREGLAALLLHQPVLQQVRSGLAWSGAIDVPGRRPVTLSAEPARGLILLTASPPGECGALAAARAEAFDRLGQGVVHDARNPLNALAIHLELARARLAELDPASSERAMKHVTAARDQIARVEQVLKRFLRFAAPPANSGDIDLAELVREAVEVCTHEARRHGVRLETQLGAARIVGNVAQIAAAVLQLVLRAIDATGAGGRLLLAVQGEGPEAMLRVTTEPGEAVGPCPKAEACGGLADLPLCAAGQMVELHRGWLSARAHGEGSEVEVRLPAAPAGRAGT